MTKACLRFSRDTVPREHCCFPRASLLFHSSMSSVGPTGRVTSDHHRHIYVVVTKKAMARSLSRKHRFTTWKIRQM